MVDEPIVGTLLGFAFFAGMVYLIYEAMRIDPKAFMAWYRWRMRRPLPQDYNRQVHFEAAYVRWRYTDRPLGPVFRKRS